MDHLGGGRRGRWIHVSTRATSADSSAKLTTSAVNALNQPDGLSARYESSRRAWMVVFGRF